MTGTVKKEGCRVPEYRFPLNNTFLLTVCLGLIMHISVLNQTGEAAESHQADHVILIVLEGVGNHPIQSGTMPIVGKLAREGAVTWSAQTVSLSLTVPAMASLLTGLPVQKHRVNKEWERYDFGRSFLRAPTVFDYMDLAGGKDSAVFFMDDRLYQLSRPEIYVDRQVCGTERPECTPQTVSDYVQDYLKKVVSKQGHGFRLFAIPDLLLVHFPTAAQQGEKFGWDSDAYHQALLTVDHAIAHILQAYKELNALDRTMVIVTGLNGGKAMNAGQNGTLGHGSSHRVPIPWLTWGINIKPGYHITRPVSLMDTGATILYALGLHTYTEWDSHAIKEIFQTEPEHRTTENE